MPLTLSCVVLTDVAPSQFLTTVRDVESAGVPRVWTYDHLSWRTGRDDPWFAAVPLLAAAAAVTDRIRLGTLVATPNFRHPVPFAKEVVALDHLSGGRLDVGVGAGADSHDATVLGEPAWTRRERTARFEEWTGLLVTLLENGRTDVDGRYYSARDARTMPGCVQRPRAPLTVAAAGPRGMRVAARHAQTWVTYGDVQGDVSWLDAVERQNRELDRILAEEAPTRVLRRAAAIGVANVAPFASRGAYDDTLGRLAQVGFDEVCVPWPRQDGRGVPVRDLDFVLSRHL